MATALPAIAVPCRAVTPVEVPRRAVALPRWPGVLKCPVVSSDFDVRASVTRLALVTTIREFCIPVLNCCCRDFSRIDMNAAMWAQVRSNRRAAGCTTDVSPNARSLSVKCAGKGTGGGTPRLSFRLPPVHPTTFLRDTIDCIFRSCTKTIIA